MRKMKIDVKLSFFANSLPMNNQNSGSDKEFLFPISYLEKNIAKGTTDPGVDYFDQ